MKYSLIIALIFIICLQLHGQETSVENEVWGIQVGIPPLAIFNESKLTNDATLRSELNFSFFYSGAGQNWAIIPNFHVEPRFYYNLQRRIDKQKIIKGNSANFLSLAIGYEPGLAIKTKDTKVDPNLYFIPAYGIRRKLGNHFNFELVGGIGYGIVFKERTNWLTKKKSTYKDSGTAYSLRIAFEYQF